MKNDILLKSATGLSFFFVITAMGGIFTLTGCDIIGDALTEYFDCEQNESQTCRCPDGSNGVQYCAPDAGTWNVCVCSERCTPQAEICDGIDNDCDGETDEGVLWFRDNDLDGRGNPAEYVESCNAPDSGTETFVSIGDDCNDDDADHWTTGPHGVGCDDDCVDLDSDGFGTLCDLGDDCDDNDISCNNDCTTYYHDKDGDGFGDAKSILESCTELEDYVTDNTDCDDQPGPDGCGADCYPGNPERCDLQDNDCDPNTPDATNCEFGCIEGVAGQCYPDCNPQIQECCNSQGVNCSHCCGGNCLPWLDEAWAYRIALEIQGSRVQEDLDQFPIYVDFSHLRAHFLHHINQTGAGDVRVTTTDGITELPFELIFDQDLGEGALYFRADTISPTENTSFYIYYGNENAAAYSPEDAFGAANVWTGYFRGVWHMEDTLDSTPATGGTKDSTAGAHHGNAIGVSRHGNGQLTGAGLFGQSTTSRVSIPPSTAFDFQTRFTLSAWVHPNSGGTNVILSKGDPNQSTGFSLAIVNDKIVFQSGGEIKISSNAPIPQNAWTHVALTGNETVLTLYLDGKNAGSTIPADLRFVQEAQLLISSAFYGQEFKGMIDEVRVAGETRTAGWIKTAYRNQSNPVSFYKVRMDTCDSDHAEHPECDADGDGSIDATCSGGTDCDDSPLTGATCTDNCQSYYVDADGDGVGNGTLSQVTACPLPKGNWPGLSASGGDCDDTNTDCYTDCKLFYRDADGDGHGVPTPFVEACVRPDGYAENNTDCDDGDNAHWSPPSEEGAPCDDDCIDRDGDGFGMLCDLTHEPYGDCDDEDASVHQRRSWYLDEDGDGWGDIDQVTEEVCSIVPPEGHVANSADLDDDPNACGAHCYPNAPDICDEIDNDNDGTTDEDPDRVWFPDCDEDGYGDLNRATEPRCDSPHLPADDCDKSACNCPNQFIDTKTYPDCDDSHSSCNLDCNSDIDFDGVRDCSDPCVDLDRDSFGIGDDCENLDEFHQWSFDCNETDNTCHSECAIFYPDVDGDDHGDSDLSKRLVSCSFDIPSGYVVNFDDCDDSDGAHWTIGADGACQDLVGCRDEDGDGFGTGCDQEGDCNDSDSRCHANCTDFYRDLDKDGYGAARPDDKGEHFGDTDFDAGLYKIVSCVPEGPLGYVDNKDDCFDGNEQAWTLIDGGLDVEVNFGPDASVDIYCANRHHCRDEDGDGHGPMDGSSCDLGNDDCDDSPQTGGYCIDNCNIYYPDVDGDGYGNWKAPTSLCVRPTGEDVDSPADFVPYVTNNDDCDDEKPLYWSNCNCIDRDQDGYGEGCDLGPDCDDDPIIGKGCQETGCSFVYPDLDGDGHAGAGDAIRACLPSGIDATVERLDIVYYGEVTDCDDTNPHAWSGSFPDCNPGCQDDDGDGRGSKGDCDVARRDCQDDPSRFCGRDCDDTDPTRWTAVSFGEFGIICANEENCIDRDGDHHGVGCDLGDDCDDDPDKGAAHWTWNAAGDGCKDLTDGLCDDPDRDGYGPGCDLGSVDCNNEELSGNPCHEGCQRFYPDMDGDGHRDLDGGYTGCPGLQGHVSKDAPLDYCDKDPQHWSAESVSGAGCDDDCVDQDGDGFGQHCDLGEDCDDTPSTGRACASNCRTFYYDGDNDEFGNTLKTVQACAPPENYVALGGDCDDANASCTLLSECVSAYKDTDGDGYGDPATHLMVCPITAEEKSPFGDGLVENDHDCDDTGEMARFRWFVCDSRCTDADRDGYGDGCDMGDDCDDAECDDGKCKTGETGKYWNKKFYYTDMDGDGVGDSSSKFEDCAGRLDGKFATKGGDCDDSVQTGAACHHDCNTFFMDNDGDGLGKAEVITCATTPPDNAVFNNLDCVDKDVDCKLPCYKRYLDHDKDGKGDPKRWIETCDAEDSSGTWVDNNTDCDDRVKGNTDIGWSCPSIPTCLTYYADKDNDTYGDTSDSISGCLVSAPKDPDRPNVAFVLNSDDCNDNDANHHEDCDDKSCLIDKDGDGYPEGTGCDVESDCDDTPRTGPSCHTKCNYYLTDRDNDGAPLNWNFSPSYRGVCPGRPKPSGYASVPSEQEDYETLECDNDKNRTPGTAEICDGIDNDCDGVTDNEPTDCETGCIEGVCRNGTSCATGLTLNFGLNPPPDTNGTNNFQVNTDYWCAGAATPGNDAIWQVTIPAGENNFFRARLLGAAPNGVLALITDCSNPVGSCLSGTNATDSPDGMLDVQYVNATEKDIQAYLVFDGMDPNQEVPRSPLVVTQSALPEGDHCASPLKTDKDDAYEWTITPETSLHRLVEASCAPSQGVEQVWSVELAAHEVLSIDLNLKDPEPDHRTMYLVESCQNPAQCLAAGDSAHSLIYENRSDVTLELFVVVDGANYDDSGSYEITINRSLLCTSVDDCRADYAFDHACIGGVCTPVTEGGNNCSDAWSGIGSGSYSSSTAYQGATTQSYNPDHCEQREAPGKDEVWEVSIPVGHMLSANYYELRSSPDNRVLYLMDQCDESPEIESDDPCLPGDTHPNSASLTYINLSDTDFTGYLVCDSDTPSNEGGGGAPYGLDVSIEPVETGDHWVSILNDPSYLIRDTGQYRGDTTPMSNLLQSDQFALAERRGMSLEHVASDGRDEVWRIEVPNGSGILYTLDASWPNATMYTVFPAEAETPIEHPVVTWTGYAGEEYYQYLGGSQYPRFITVYLVVDGAATGNYGPYTLNMQIGPNVKPKSECDSDAECLDDNPCTQDSCSADGQCVNNNVEDDLNEACDDRNICTQDVCEAGACKNQPLPPEQREQECDDNLCTTGDMCDDKGSCRSGGQTRNCETRDPCVKGVCDKAKGCIWINQIGPCDHDDDSCTMGSICQDGACVEGNALYTCEDFGQHCGDTGCVECLDDDHCQAGHYCPARQNNTCATCATDTHCGPSCVNCTSSNMVCADDDSGCVQCTEDTHCGTGKWCNDNTCETCDTVRHCGPSCSRCDEEELCDGNSCVECTSDDNCQFGEMCNTDTNTCEACGTADDYCGPSCSDCVGGGLVCSDRGTCVECTDSNDCIFDPELPRCDTENQRCVQCTINSDCSFDPERPLCDGANKQCVSCLAGSCTAGSYCDENENRCQSCESDDHCGDQCLPCGADTPHCAQDEDSYGCVQCVTDGDCTGISSPTLDACNGTTLIHYPGTGVCTNGACAPNFAVEICENACTVDAAGVGSCIPAEEIAGQCGLAIKKMYKTTASKWGATTWGFENSNDGWDFGGLWERTEDIATTGGTFVMDYHLPGENPVPNNTSDRNRLATEHDLTSCAPCVVNAEYKVTGISEAGADFLRAQCRGNGTGDWTEISTTSGTVSDWTEVDSPIPASCLDTEFNMSFLFETNESVQHEGFYVDDVRIYNATPHQGRGAIETVDTTAITGWACNSLDYAGPVDVSVVFLGGSYLSRTVTANGARSAETACNGTANHGWTLTLDPELKADLGSGTHDFVVNGIVPTACGGGRWYIPGSVQKVTL